MEHRVTISARDAILYALSVGAGSDTLDLVWEARGPRVLGTMVSTLAFSAEAPLREAMGGTPEAAVFGASELEADAPVPVGVELTLRSAVEGIYDLGRMGVVVYTTDVSTPEGRCARQRTTLWYLRDGGFGGPRPPPQPRTLPPSGPPDHEVDVVTLPTQALLFRLNGDLNPLHVDPAAAVEGVTTAGPILHGLATFGMLGLTVERLTGTPLKRLVCRYAKPVFPGDMIRVSAWRDADRLSMRAASLARPEEEVISHAAAWVAR